MENQTEPKRKESLLRRCFKFIWGLIPVCLLVFLIFTLGDTIVAKQEAIKHERMSAMTKDIEAVNVVVMELVPKPIRDRINLPGITEPWIKLDVLTQLKGTVVKKPVKEGDVVKKGDILIALDSRDYLNNHRSAKASYKSALASLNRLKALYKDQLATQSQLDNSVAAMEISQAAMKNAALDLARCVIKAPISGTVNHVFIEEGQYLNPSSRIAEIIQTDRIKVKVGIPESDVNALRSVNDFDVKIDALGGKVFKAKKYYLSKTAAAGGRLYNLDLVINNDSGEILPDMFTRVEIVKREKRETLSIPLYSAISLNNENIVYVVKDETVSSRRVEFGMQEGWMIEIVEGLKERERVIIVGQRSVSNGQKVNIIQTVTDMEELTR
ncbi:efflux RND transporter periplasmic adaptor subunit [Thermodesulfobacteriota bacterium]